MKTWIVGVVTAIVVVVAGAGLWLTWDDTRTSATETASDGPIDVPVADEIQQLTGDTEPPAACTHGDDLVEADPLTEWHKVVVDPGHRLPADFSPPDLVGVEAAGFERTGDRIRQIVVPDLAALRRAAEANGTPFIVVSAFRSYEYQQRLFANQVALAGRDQAEESTARPGHSEHQLGTTIDILDPVAAELTPAFTSTPTGRWVAAHAHRYGFVMSYPDEARDRTCYDFEPWHVRYVGRETAQSIHDSGRTPREWMISHSHALR